MSSTSTYTLQQSGTSSSSSSTACTTTPEAEAEAGTYCGFINPEDACTAQPAGSGPQSSLDALNPKTPSQYQEDFKKLNASTSANPYLTYETLPSYNVSGCATFCDNTDLCTAFNIYNERDPSVNPTTNGTGTDVGWGSDCPKPSSITNYKCSLWGSSIGMPPPRPTTAPTGTTSKS
ncbi:hypothetical protein LTR36_006020 [Oleoguttula mirabilis]|uniref:Apple domain-containing protein n=1 Tax=Oleoguttula mirabilis TaxID=1507867 RepID=A0AAV9JCZ2_9PEZI|nr:hypothetical protein LTR36_006020 [Oleoguttula mirabilis]